MVIICCKDHAELGIDIIVDEFETPPVVELLTENDELSTGCEYCDNKGVYKVSNI
ncbi:CxxH/CxxC protein [Fictibacillus nanhaiensis]|uniref:CxxH/CxxC protein n=1 Tax=Fictibacillus nanhaiensis TaxID=742169 RepID=UPI003C1C857F